MLRGEINQVHRIMHRAVARGESRRSLTDVRHISIDEKALKRGHTCATIVSDSDLGVVLDVGQGRIQRRHDRSIGARIIEEIGEEVDTVSTDMWRGFIGAVKQVFPKAILIHDRFHLIQYLNKSINQVRKREVKDHPELKGSRYALLKNEKIARKNKKKFSRWSRNPTSM